MMVNRGQAGCCGGDWNCITDKNDATNRPESKISLVLSRALKTFNWNDSFRTLHSHTQSFSRFYKVENTTEATRIDRQYHWGQINIQKCEYIPAAFSDHLGLLVEVNIPQLKIKSRSPKASQQFKIKDEIIYDSIFKSRVNLAMSDWRIMLSHGLSVLTWWELVVKPGLKSLAMERRREMNDEQRGELNMLLIQQAYIVKKHKYIHPDLESLTDLHSVQSRIRSWYDRRSSKFQIQTRKDEF